jgi:hypothetical protein
VKRNREDRRRAVSIARKAVCLLFALLCQGVDAEDGQATPQNAAEKRVTFYHTYGYLHDQDWVILMRLWVHEAPAPAQRGLAKAARRLLAKRAGLVDPSDAQVRLFEQHSNDFFADSESKETVRFRSDVRIPSTANAAGSCGEFNSLSVAPVDHESIGNR